MLGVQGGVLGVHRGVHRGVHGVHSGVHMVCFNPFTAGDHSLECH